MSTASPLPERAMRTVSDYRGGHPDREMDAVGWLIMLPLLLILLPLAPFILLVWLASRLSDRGARGRERQAV